MGYDGGAARFLGATLEPTPLYRFNAVCSMLAEQGLDVDALHRHSAALQERFLDRVDGGDAGPLALAELTLAGARSRAPGAGTSSPSAGTTRATSRRASRPRASSPTRGSIGCGSGSGCTTAPRTSTPSWGGRAELGAAGD